MNTNEKKKEVQQKYRCKKKTKMNLKKQLLS